MIAPAYSMDAAPMVYEASLPSSGTRAGAMAYAFIHTTFVPTMDRSPRQLQPPQLAGSSTSTAASFDASESAPQNLVARSAADIGLEKVADTNSRSSNGISNAGSRDVDSRARLARLAFASGWIFLALALFCLAQSFLVVSAAQQRRWRPAARAHS